MNATVKSIAKIADTLYLISLAPASPLAFKAGQFIIISLPPETEGGKLPKGYYSIASAEQAGHEIVLLVEHRPEGGYVSKWMSARQPGDALQLEGPLGKFQLQEDGTPVLAFLGYKAGLAPLRSMILSQLASGSQREAWLFLGGEPLFDAEWKALAVQHPHFHYVSLQDPAAACTQALQGKALEIYVAGFTKEVEPIQAGLLEAGFAKESMHIEKFG